MRRYDSFNKDEWTLLQISLDNLKIPKIVCLCGSTRFYKEFREAEFNETMNGNIVLTVGFFPHSSEKTHGQNVGVSEKDKDKLDELHKKKIDLADEIFVINVSGYIGESTKSEIKYAQLNNKPVRFLENHPITKIRK
jgi:hypothetical protein